MIYLDSAATTLQKPPAVARAVARAVGTLTTPGRGGHPPAMRAAETAFQCRELAARLFDVPSPEQVVFTFNATHGLNIALRTLVKPGDRVVLSGYEHNAVLRPLRGIGAELEVVRAPLFCPEAMAAGFEAALTEGTACAVCTQVSNVFGYRLPVERVAELCRERGIPLIVDASQSAGMVPLSLTRLGADFIAMPGHKGLYGPQGTGLLLCGRGEVEPLLEGGTGTASTLSEMPPQLPDRLEAGTQNLAGIAGLLEGLRFVERTGVERLGRWEAELAQRCGDLLAAIPGVEVFRGPAGKQTGVLSFRVEGRDCETVGETLARRGIAVRAGLHCAPLAHETAGTLATGTLRASFSAFTGERAIRCLAGALREND